MRTFNVVVERDPDTGVLVGSVQDWPGAHSQGATFDELQENFPEVIAMLLEDGDPDLESEFVALQPIQAAQPWAHCRSPAAPAGYRHNVGYRKQRIVLFSQGGWR